MKQLLLLLFLTGWTWEARAQSAQIPKEPTNVQSPNAASLGMYGEVPVSLYTGLPGIEVPLYTAQEGTLTVPVKLEYHASGFRPDMHPGWVGMGWSLEAGGVISRSVRDTPDEDDASSGGYRRGYYYNGGRLSGTGWSDPTNLQSIASSSLNGGGDTEPDEFSFNFNGYSGKFYLNADGTWKVKCNRPLKVTSTVPGMSSPFQASPIPYPQNSTGASSTGAPQTFAGFTITIEDGTQYVFGGPKEVNAVELQLDIFNEFTDYWVASSWYLTQIIHPDGHQVTLKYERDANDYIAQMYVSLQDNIEIRTVSAGIFNTGPNCIIRNGSSIAYSYKGKLISPVYLRSIQTTQSTVYFDRAPSVELPYRTSIFDTKVTENRRPMFLYLGQNDQYNSIPYPTCLNNLKWKQLNTIRVSSTPSSQPIKNFLFCYNNNNPNLQERLMLTAVTEQGADGSTKPAYRFGYNKYRKQPDYLAGKNDHWDFYNNNARYATVNDYNNANIDYATYYSDRNSNPDSAVYLTGMLTRLVYPTGGVTEFLYEQHTYSKQLDEARSATLQLAAGNAGGVRIKKITSYSLDNPQQKLEKEYLYVTGYSPGTSNSLPSSGILGGQVRYLFDDYRAKATVAENTVYSKKIFSTQSVLPACSNSQGSHIGYSTVIEKRSDGGYTQYRYSNFDTGNGDEAPLAVLQADIQNSRTIYSPYSSKEEERGKLLQEEIFNKTGQRVKQRLVEYVAFGKETGYVPAMQAISMYVCPDVSPDRNPTIEEGTAYKIYTYSYLPNKETETLYDTNGQNPITTVKSILYSPNTSLGYGLVASESSTDSKNQTVLTTYRYPFDLTFPVATPPLPLSDPVASAVYAMVAKNMVGLPIETTTSRNGFVTGATVQTYRLAGPDKNRLLPFQLFRLEAPQPLSQYTPTAYGSQADSPLNIAGGNSQMQLKATFTQYDAIGNPLNLVKGGLANMDYSITGGTSSSYLWGYRNALPVAKVENAAPTEIFHSNFEETAGWDAALTYDNQRARTGLLAGKLTSFNRGDQYHSFGTAPLTIALTAPKKFVFSGWVYSEGPTAQLWLFMYRAGETGYFTYYEYLAIEPADLNKWVYLEKEVEVPADVVKLNYRLTNFYRSANSTGGRTWFDDVRIHPAEAQMTTYTHQPGVGVTSVSDANNRSMRYEYDGLNRLGTVRDQEGNILKQMEYHFQR